MPREVVVSFQGGLGNRLFQLSAGLAIAARVGGRVRPHGPDDDTASSLERLVGPLEPHASPRTLARLGLVPAAASAWTDLAIRAARTLGWAAPRRLGTVGPFSAAPQLLPTRGPMAVVGYAQHPSFFADGVDAVVSRIILRRSDAGAPDRRPAEPGRIVLHLRRGDYVALGWALSTEYYRSALRRLADTHELRGEGVLVVGDDPMASDGLAAALQRDGWDAVVASDPSGDEEARILVDFMSIVDAPAVVMSNSTYCWWATCVGDRLRTGRPVAFPTDWTGSGGGVLYRPGWVGVP